MNERTGKLLEGKVVLVTGAGGGVGEGVARLAAEHGAKVLVNDLGVSLSGDGNDTAPAQRVADDIVKAGGQAAANFNTIADWDSAHAIVQDALDRFGRLDVVVNNAGIVRDAIFHKMTRSDWDMVRNVNLDGYFYVSRAAADPFRAQGGGCFIHMTSTSGLIGNMGQVNYAAAKLGVAALSKNIAIDMARFNVRSNCIAPFAFTRMVESIADTSERNRQRLEGLKLLKADKVAPLAVALMADDAAGITGQIFGSRNNELMVFSQPRPVRSVQMSEGWTPQSCLATAIPALKPSMYPLDKSGDVFVWDPV